MLQTKHKVSSVKILDKILDNTKVQVKIKKIKLTLAVVIGLIIISTGCVWSIEGDFRTKQLQKIAQYTQNLGFKTSSTSSDEQPRNSRMMMRDSNREKIEELSDQQNQELNQRQHRSASSSSSSSGLIPAESPIIPITHASHSTIPVNEEIPERLLTEPTTAPTATPATNETERRATVDSPVNPNLQQTDLVNAPVDNSVNSSVENLVDVDSPRTPGSASSIPSSSRSTIATGTIPAPPPVGPRPNARITQTTPQSSGSGVFIDTIPIEHLPNAQRQIDQRIDRIILQRFIAQRYALREIRFRGVRIFLGRLGF